MEQFAKKPDTEKREILQETASRRGIRDIIIEKDFWVCWTLGRLYTRPELSDHITFKGGTSLSKAYGLIERFSEDIDLTIGRTAPHICDTDNPMEAKISNKERERRIKVVKKAAQNFVMKVAMPLLSLTFEQSLETNKGWSLEPDKGDPDQQTLLFYYPRIMNYGMGFGHGTYGAGRWGEGEAGYIKPTVKLEFGARGEVEPHELKTMTPYVAEDFPQFFERPTVSVTTLVAERTFWEKVTILHALYHEHTLDHDTKLRDRMSRHYYDTYMMAENGIADAALRQPELLRQVVLNKSLMFRKSKASYETATMAKLKLVPTHSMLTDLQKDYTAMQEMFMGDAPDFKAIMQRLTELEEQIQST